MSPSSFTVSLGVLGPLIVAFAPLLTPASNPVPASFQSRSAQTCQEHFVFEDSAASTSENPKCKVLPAELAAVEEIRRSRGSLLDGTLLAGAGEETSEASEEFRQAMAVVAASQPGETPWKAPSHDPIPLEPTVDSVRQQSYQACRLMEQAAWELEATEQYELADRARALADAIRIEARKSE